MSRNLTAVITTQGGWGAEIRVTVAATPEADAAAVAFLGRHAGHVDHDATGDDLSSWPLVQDLYYPICEHGMDGRLCYGPSHYCSDEEIAQGW